ncbi:hypothetical protein [Achromobacter pulmonis]|uniref:hypothetical protein n=1 Tax=Achromobacter pulmonis TaxID=1389932 RepID=UPI0015814972|nr:hypothetical protein [Achromobacter pulmonis]
MAAVTLFSLILAVYFGMFYERKPALTAVVNSLSPVFDVLKPVGGLDISYGGIDLREAKKSLWSADLTLRNEGNSEVRLDSFDSNAPVRISVQEAQIVDRPSALTSNDYLRDHVKLITDANSIVIAPIIIEPGDTISVNFLILGAEGNRPKIEILGKIAGMRGIPLTSIDSSAEQGSWFSQAVGANSIWVQLIRTPIYFFAFLVLIAVLVLLGSAISTPFSRFAESRQQRTRREEIRKLRREHAFDQRENSLADEYIERGLNSIRSIARTTHSAKSKLKAMETICSMGDTAEIRHAALEIGPPMTPMSKKRLISLGLIAVEDGKITGIEDLDTSIRRLCEKLGKNHDELIKEGRKHYVSIAGTPMTTWDDD